MQTLEAQYEIVTPMFIGGAHPNDAPEIRPPSVKGALRFWWRALQWGNCLNDHHGDVNVALKHLYLKEAELFGAAAKEDQFGQGKISLKIKIDNGKRELAVATKNGILPNPAAGQCYLLGQGLYHFKDGFLRAAISPSQSFSVILKLHDTVSAQSIADALMAFGLLGGLGSRARKGWGAIAIRSLAYTDQSKKSQTLPVPNDIETYKKCLTQLLSQPDAPLPPFSAFSKHSRIDISTMADNPLQALNQVGEEMQHYRSYGQKKNMEHKVNGKKAEQNFKEDHDLVLDFAHGKVIKDHPRRVVFGLPHNYFYSNGTKVDVDAYHDGTSRRASPVIIHIHQFSSGRSIGIHCLLKSQFLPERGRIQLKKGHKSQSVECDVDWKVIEAYLERFTQGERIL